MGIASLLSFLVYVIIIAYLHYYLYSYISLVFPRKYLDKYQLCRQTDVRGTEVRLKEVNPKKVKNKRNLLLETERVFASFSARTQSPYSPPLLSESLRYSFIVFTSYFPHFLTIIAVDASHTSSQQVLLSISSSTPVRGAFFSLQIGNSPMSVYRLIGFVLLVSYFHYKSLLKNV
jgi:hypothetical protein